MLSQGEDIAYQYYEIPGGGEALAPTSLADILREPRPTVTTPGEDIAADIRLTAERATRGIENTVSNVSEWLQRAGSWIQAVGGTAALIAVLGLGAWGLSSMAAIRRRT